MGGAAGALCFSRCVGRWGVSSYRFYCGAVPVFDSADNRRWMPGPFCWTPECRLPVLGTVPSSVETPGGRLPVLGTVPPFPPGFLHTSIVGLLRRLVAVCCGVRRRLWLDRHWGLGVPIASFAGHAWPGTVVHDDGLCLLRWMGQLLLSTAHGGWGWWCWELVPSPPLWGSGLRGGVGCWPRHFHLGCSVEDVPPLWVSEWITLCSLTVSTRLVPHTIVSP